ncbi:hypothetical protein BJV82DRAFT_669025 [Fennellomyces sp. T-0311]|nr:hypothetical protein BJV82DRAFT_669025 [Fennellomyces sp. T-0311]
MFSQGKKEESTARYIEVTLQQLEFYRTYERSRIPDEANNSGATKGEENVVNEEDNRMLVDMGGNVLGEGRNCVLEKDEHKMKWSPIIYSFKDETYALLTSASTAARMVTSDANSGLWMHQHKTVHKDDETGKIVNKRYGLVVWEVPWLMTIQQQSLLNDNWWQHENQTSVCARLSAGTILYNGDQVLLAICLEAYGRDLTVDAHYERRNNGSYIQVTYLRRGVSRVYPGRMMYFFKHKIIVNCIPLVYHLAFVRWYSSKEERRFVPATLEEWLWQYKDENDGCITPIHRIHSQVAVVPHGAQADPTTASMVVIPLPKRITV